MTTLGATEERVVLDLPADTRALEALTRGEIDIQIATAKRYPRSIQQFQQQALSMATIDEDTAAACFYVLPKRQGSDKPIEGPSVRLAEIVASAWGHMRVEGRMVGEDDRFITCRGTAWDLQNNVAIAIEVRRRITTREGRRYSDDMINVTSMAGVSIAVRNCVFKVIPNAYTKQIYHKCREVVAGKADTLVARRQKAIEYFGNMGINLKRLFAMLEIKGIEDLASDQLITLHGLATAIREGDLSLDEAFPVSEIEMPRRKSEAMSAAPSDQVAAATRTITEIPPASSSAEPAVSASPAVKPEASDAAAPLRGMVTFGGPVNTTPHHSPARSAATDTVVPVAASTSSTTSTAGSDTIVYIGENDRRRLFGAIRNSRKTVPQLSSYLQTKYGIASTKLIPVEKFAEILAWVSTRGSQEPGQEG